MDSILVSIKKLLGIAEDYEPFDADLIMHINTVFMVLNQLGVGPVGGFCIEDHTATWDDFIDGEKNLSAVKTYVFLKVKMIFDPPMGSIAAEAYENMIQELESRLNMEVDS